MATIKTYRFRYEAYIDYTNLKKIFPDKNAKWKTVDNTVIELKTTLTLAQVTKQMLRVIDGHVMAQTVKPVKTFTGERTKPIGWKGRKTVAKKNVKKGAKTKSTTTKKPQQLSFF